MDFRNKRMAVAMLALLSVGSCQTTSNKTGVATSLPPSLPASALYEAAVTEHKTLTHSVVPALSFAVGRPKHVVDLFVDPSCPDCIRLFGGFMQKGVLDHPAYKDTTINFILVPRHEQDYTTIKNLMCVGPDKFDIAVVRHFRRMHDAVLSNRTDGWLKLAVDTSQEVAQELGVSFWQLQGCQDRDDIDQLTYAQWYFGMKDNPAKTWPHVWIDQKPARVETFDQVTSALSRAKGI